jgi:hypothetical protein
MDKNLPQQLEMTTPRHGDQAFHFSPKRGEQDLVKLEGSQPA